MELIQDICFPEEDICMIEKMFFKVKGEARLENDGNSRYYKMRMGSSISTNTYFNTFSSSKWIKYTIIHQFILNIEVKGDFFVNLYHCYLEKDEVIRDKVKTVHVNCEKKETISIAHDFTLDAFEELYYIEIISNNDNCEFYGGGYYTDNVCTLKPHLGIVICTYKREKFILNNLRLLARLENFIDVFIIDNAMELQVPPQKENIHVIGNKNTGGSGGFTRGIIEILTNQKQCSHILLMDDDILISIATLKKTLAFLSFLKEDSKDLFIGGGTLSLSRKNKQLESAAVWNNNILYNLKHNLNLSKEKDLLLNNLEESRSYNSWVYFCMPVCKLSLEALPLPLFVRGDDMEYGIFLTGKILTMNGIGVWHVPVDNKYSSFMNYYVIRNILILNALYEKDFTSQCAIKLLWGRILRECFFYRYKDAELILRAFSDFMQGTKFFTDNDGEEIHKSIMNASTRLLTYKALEKEGTPFINNQLIKNINKEKLWHKVIRYISLNGYLLPKCCMKNEIKYRTVELTNTKPIMFFRYRKILQIDLPGQKGYIARMDKIQFAKIVYKTLRLSYLLLRNNHSVIYDYMNNINKIRNYEFWKKYLNI